MSNDEEVPRRPTVYPIRYLISGGVGGICTIIVGHPLDTIKVRLQTMPSVGPGETTLYKGTWDCLVRTISHEGFKGLYKGMSIPVYLATPIFALWFFGFGWGKRLQMDDPDAQLSLSQLAKAGACSAFFTCPVQVPGERVKCLLQVQQAATGPANYFGPTDVLKKLYKENGVRNIYVGTLATLLREVPAKAMYFMTYEGLKRSLIPEDSKEMFILRTLIAGGLAGVANWVVAIPADVLKSRQQTAPFGRYPRGLPDVYKELIREEGITGLYKGYIPTFLRAFPANAACFVGFEITMTLINWLFPHT